MAEGAGDIPRSTQAPSWRQTLMRRGALAIGASAMPGAVNYAIVLGLTFFLSPAATGEYRLLFSYFALANLLCAYESHKIYVRATATMDRPTATAALVNQGVIGVLLLVAAVSLQIADAAFPWDVPAALTVIALFSAVYMPSGAYLPVLQGRECFTTLFIVEALKYGSALSAFLGVLWLTGDITTAMYVQFGVMTAWNIALFATFAARLIDWRALPASPLQLLRSPPAAEARLLSVGALLPGMLEQVDKIVLAASHGLAVVGIYTLGFSTGRFIYNTLKPALYVFYRQFSIAMPAAAAMRRAFIGFTLLGVALALVLLLTAPWHPDELKAAQPVATILFFSYGVAMCDAIYVQSYAINPTKQSSHVLIANCAGAAVCAPLFAVAPFVTAASAMVVLALHYPIRHIATIVFLRGLELRDRQG